jgi:hypothetical protein
MLTGRTASAVQTKRLNALLQPMLGRAFLADEFSAEGERVILLSHSYWQRRCGASPAIAGQTLKINGQAHTVVGVLPADFKMALPSCKLEVVCYIRRMDKRRWSR